MDYNIVNASNVKVTLKIKSVGINYKVKINGILDTGMGEAEALDKLMEEINY